MVALRALLSTVLLSSIARIAAGFDVKDLQYGPEHGVDHAHPLPKNFDDTTLITVGLQPKAHRELVTFTCTYMGHYFIGLATKYAVPGSDAPADHVFSNYRGWMPIVAFRAKNHSYTLAKDGDKWEFLSFRYCGRKLTGIHFKSTKGGVSCGNYDYTVKADGCGGDTFRPAAGRKIVGIYGDANGVLNTKAQGIRGIGLITLPSSE